MKTINVDGVAYVEKNTSTSGYSMVRTERAGVFCGKIKSRDGGEAVLTDARRMWMWSGAASLSELATKGPSNQGGCKFPASVDEVTLLGVIEIIPVTDAAKKAIDGVEEWTKH